MERRTNLDIDIEKYKKRGRDFVVKKSRYSGEIILNGVKTKYSNNTISYATFGYFASLKKELKNELDYFNSCKKEEGYFIHGKFELCDSDKIYNIDISGAYLSALYRTGIITDALFSKIKLLSKGDRLVCLGLLAYEPCFFEYENGIEVNYYKRNNPYKNVFLYCVKEIFHISRIIQKKLGDDFLFSWVDGFYFKHEKNIIQVQNILRSNGYKFTTNRLFNFIHESKKEGFSTFDYTKFEKTELQDIRICVPGNDLRREKDLCLEINSLLLEKDYEAIIKKFHEKNHM